MKTLELSIKGMSCAHCVRAVTDALKGVDGVQLDDVQVGSARLKYDVSVTSVGALVDAVMDAGYEADEATG